MPKKLSYRPKYPTMGIPAGEQGSPWTLPGGGMLAGGGSFSESGAVPGQSYNYTSPGGVVTPYLPAVNPVANPADAWNKPGYAGDPTGVYSPVEQYAKSKLQRSMSSY